MKTLDTLREETRVFGILLCCPKNDEDNCPLKTERDMSQFRKIHCIEQMDTGYRKEIINTHNKCYKNFLMSGLGY